MADGTCSIDGCEGKTVARGWCGTHWKRWKRTGDPGSAEVRVSRYEDACLIDDCDRLAVSRGWCGAHYARWQKTGDPGGAEIRPPRADFPGECSVEGCTAVTKAHSFCETHYRRWKRHGDPSVVERMRGIATECLVEDCGEPVKAWGMCHLHYCRWRRHGDPLLNMLDLEPRIERFWARVDRQGPVPEYAPDLGPCWIWTDRLTDDGYGDAVLSVDGVRHRLAYRVAFVLCVGAVAPGLELDHLCRVRSCVNPAHLEPVTGTENLRRGRMARGLAS